MKRHVAYYRVSTQKQGKSGLGLDAQKRDIQLYLDNYCQGCEVIAEFTDIESGSNSDRPELKNAIAKAKAENAILLVAKLDRLSRKVSQIAQLMEDEGLTFRVAQMPEATAFQLHIYAALAQQERDFISKRTKAALKEAQARGKQLGGLRDATMKRNQAKQEKAAQDAERYREAVMPYVNQGLSLREIASALNSVGVKTARGSDWNASTISRLLKRLGVKG